jgi:hypothetical protein
MINVTFRPLYSQKDTRYPVCCRPGGPQGWFVRVRKISSSLRFDPRTVQPVASRYTLSRPIEIFQQKLKLCHFFPAFFYLPLCSVLCKIVQNRTSSCPMETSAALWVLCRKHSRPTSKQRAAPRPHTVYYADV